MNLGQENEAQEFKISLAQLDKGLKSLTAMLNRHGSGTVYFGVNDDGNVVGLQIGKKTLSDIRDRISIAVDPKLVTQIDALDDEGKQYVRVRAQGSDIPYSFDGRYYWRNVSSDEQASNELLRKMLAAGDSDLIRQIDSVSQELTFRGLISELTNAKLHARDTPQFRQSFGLTSKEGRLNLMAYLLSDQNSFELKVVRFAGVDKSVMSERTVYSGQCLIKSVNAVLSYVRALNTSSVVLSEGKRIETPLFSFEAFREAWVNAALHNAWREKIPPSVFIFDDRMEVISYGGLPYGLSEDGFFQGVSVPVNRALQTVFLSAGLAEQTGHGNPIIVANYGQQAFDLMEGMVRVTIPFAFQPQSVLMRRAQTALTPNQYAVYEFLSANPAATLAEAAQATGLSLGGIKKVCSKLQQAGVLKRLGSRRNGTWVPADSSGPKVD